MQTPSIFGHYPVDNVRWVGTADGGHYYAVWMTEKGARYYLFFDREGTAYGHPIYAIGKTHSYQEFSTLRVGDKIEKVIKIDASTNVSDSFLDMDFDMSLDLSFRCFLLAMTIEKDVRLTGLSVFPAKKSLEIYCNHIMWRANIGISTEPYVNAVTALNLVQKYEKDYDPGFDVTKIYGPNKCPRCGTVNAPSYRFCMKCGHPVSCKTGNRPQ